MKWNHWYISLTEWAHYLFIFAGFLMSTRWRITFLCYWRWDDLVARPGSTLAWGLAPFWTSVCDFKSKVFIKSHPHAHSSAESIRRQPSANQRQGERARLKHSTNARITKPTTRRCASQRARGRAHPQYELFYVVTKTVPTQRPCYAAGLFRRLQKRPSIVASYNGCNEKRIPS